MHDQLTPDVKTLWHLGFQNLGNPRTLENSIFPKQEFSLVLPSQYSTLSAHTGTLAFLPEHTSSLTSHKISLFFWWNMVHTKDWARSCLQHGKLVKKSGMRTQQVWFPSVRCQLHMRSGRCVPAAVAYTCHEHKLHMCSRRLLFVCNQCSAGWYKSDI